MVPAVNWSIVQHCVPVADQESFMLIWNHPSLGTCCQFAAADADVLADDMRFPVDDPPFLFRAEGLARDSLRRNYTLDPVTRIVYVATTLRSFPKYSTHQDVLTPLWETMRLEREVKSKWK